MKNKNTLHTRKRISGIVIAAVVLLSLALGGCLWQPEGNMAELTISLENIPGARAIGADVNGLRLFLINENGEYYEFSEGKLYYAATAAETAARSVTVEVPAGNWVVAIELGKVVGSALLPMDYAVSPLTTIAPGVENSIGLASADTPFVWSGDFLGGAFNGVVTFGTTGDTIYASTPSAVYSGNSVATLTELVPGFDFNTYTINSISEGTFFDTGNNPLTDSRSELWVNTVKGILPYQNGSLVTGFQTTQFPVFASGGNFEEWVDADDPSDVTLFYETSSAFGGHNVSYDIPNTQVPDPSTWTWNVNSNFEGVFNGGLVYDFFIYGGYTYLATKLGCLRLANNFIAAGGGSLLSEAQEIVIGSGEANEVIPVYTVEYLSPGKILLGTGAGVFIATLTSAETVITDLRIIGGTENLQFTKTAATEGGAYAAAVSNTGIVLFKRIGDSYTAKIYPTYTGLPGGINAIEFIEGSSVLIIAGSGGSSLSPDGGIVQINLASLTW